MTDPTTQALPITEWQWHLLSNECFGGFPVSQDLLDLEARGLIKINRNKHGWSCGPTEEGAKLGPYPYRFGHGDIEGNA